MKGFIANLTCFLFLTVAQAQWVSTVAGVLETPGFNDGPALSARFFNPHGIAIDSLGMVYVADRYNHTIRKYDPEAGVVTTLAGKAGQVGSTDGQGSAARFNEPWGLCVSPGGTVYVADTKNNKIRKVLPDGTVSTVAGSGNYGTSNGPALTATFGDPTGIERDAAGNLYVADHLTHIIRKVSTGGIVSTLAGFPYIPGDVDGIGGEAQFWRPYGLTLDLDGNLLVADEWNHKIRRVTPAGMVTTVAGTGNIGYVNGQGANAQFNYPWDMTVDPAGNIYVADGFNYVIRKISPSGNVTALAGSPQTLGGTDGQGNAATFSGATSVAWSQKFGKIYVGDAYNHLVRTILLEGEPQAELNLLNLSGLDDICEGETLQVQAAQLGYQNYRFFLDGDLVQEDGSTAFVAAGLEAGPHALHLEAEFEGEVLVSNTVYFTVVAMPQPTISAVGPLSFYEGDSVILVASATGDLLWSNGSSEQTITVSESGTYFVEETIDGCTGMSNELQVVMTPLPDGVSVVLEGNTQLCAGTTARLVSSASAGNQWLKDGWAIPGETDRELVVSEAGIYQVQVTDANTGITVISAEHDITQLPAPDWALTATPRTGMPGQLVSFRVTGNDLPVHSDWNFGDSQPNSDLPNPQHVYIEVGSYSVVLVATDRNDCEHTLSEPSFIQIFSENTPAANGQFLPSAFTPNGDGTNDVFRMRGLVEGDFSMMIFNQWGEAIFASQNPADGWDGTRFGLPVQNGTYVYLVTLQTPEGKQQLSGHVTLLR